MHKPHVHAAVIKAWADGAEIQYLCREDVSGAPEVWCDVKAPQWDTDTKYRVKPKNVHRYCYVTTMPAGSVVVGPGVTAHSEAVFRARELRHETLRAVLHVEINPDTLELVSATMEAI